MQWWQKIVIFIIVVAAVIGIIFTIFYGIEKFSQPKVTTKEIQAADEIEKVESVEEKAEETTTSSETTIETTIKEETLETTVVKEKATETSKKASFIPEGQIPAYTSSFDGRPEDGTELYSDVGYDEIWCATFGPGEFLGVTLPGGEKTGSVVIQLGPTKIGENKTHYVITNLLPGCGWQGNWHYNERLVTEKDWMAIKNLKVKEMMGADNATDSLGCNTVMVVVAQEGKIIFQETYQKQ